MKISKMQNFENIKFILGSKSPRRQELLHGLGINFEIRTKETAENYPEELDPRLVPEYLAEIKADALLETLSANELLITSDTIVIVAGEILGKPASAEEAQEILRKLSGKSHEVITGVHLRTRNKSQSFSVSTTVFFNVLSAETIQYYVENYKPFDKAGAYGIQEWIGFVGIDRIEGSYFNVMGLPTAELYKYLTSFQF